MKTWMILAAAALALSACESQPPQTLDQKLAEASTPADRKETLRLACLNEAEWPASLHKMHAGGRRAAYERMRVKETPEIRGMKSLCRQMDDLTTADADEKIPAKDLAMECAAKVAAKKQKEVAGGDAHAGRIQRICKEMTSVKVK